MAFSPVAFIAPNYRDYKNYWLKFYEPGTTTPKSISLDGEGLTQVAKLQLNIDGFVVSAGGAIVMPYVDSSYDGYLFPTEEEADNNDTINAIRVADDITGVNGAILANSVVVKFDIIENALNEDSNILMYEGSVVYITGRDSENDGGASSWEVVDLATVTPNNDNIYAHNTLPLALVKIEEDTTVADVTYYVSPNGDDANDGLTTGTPFKTINQAISRVPYIIKHNIVIDLHSATVGVKTYAEDVLVTAAFRDMNLETGQYGSYSIVGDGADTKVQSMTITKSDVSVTNFEIQQLAPVISSESGGIMFWWCSGEASASNISYAAGFDNIAINAFASNVELRTLNLDNTTRAVRSKRGSHVQVRFCSGEVDATSGGAVYDCAEGSEIVIKDNTSVTKAGGAWYDGDQGCTIWDRDKNQIITGAERVIPEVTGTSLKVTKPKAFDNTPIPIAKIWADRTATEVGAVSFQWSKDSDSESGWSHNLYRGTGGWKHAKDGAAVMEIAIGGVLTGYAADSGSEDASATLNQLYSWDKPSGANTSALTLTYWDGASLVTRRVRVGAADSGGSGQRLLTISN